MGWLAFISIISAALAASYGAIGPALAEGRAVAAAMDAIARQPESASTISRTLFVGLAMIETMAIYCLVIALVLLFANPLLKWSDEDRLVDARLSGRPRRHPGMAAAAFLLATDRGDDRAASHRDRKDAGGREGRAGDGRVSPRRDCGDARRLRPGARRDPGCRGVLRIRAILDQPQHAPLRLADEVALVMAVQSGLLDRVPLPAITAFRRGLPRAIDTGAAAAVQQMQTTGTLDAEGAKALAEAMKHLAETVTASTVAARPHD